MKGGEMSKLFTSNEEKGVEQVNKLGKEIPPGHVESSHCSRAVRVVHRFAVPAVTTSNIECPALHEHPHAEDGLEEIVDKHDAFDLIRLPVLHKPLSPNLHYVDIEDTDCGGDPN